MLQSEHISVAGVVIALLFAAYGVFKFRGGGSRLDLLLSLLIALGGALVSAGAPGFGAGRGRAGRPGRGAQARPAPLAAHRPRRRAGLRRAADLRAREPLARPREPRVRPPEPRQPPALRALSEPARAGQNGGAQERRDRHGTRRQGL